MLVERPATSSPGHLRSVVDRLDFGSAPVVSNWDELRAAFVPTVSVQTVSVQTVETPALRGGQDSADLQARRCTGSGVSIVPQNFPRTGLPPDC